jgi:two-component system sensor histidine kinase ChvG
MTLARANPRPITRVSGFLSWLSGSILARLLLVNLFVLLLPWAGLEFARIHERQLLVSLERDMRNQAALVGEVALESLLDTREFDTSRLGVILTRAARTTRTRVRIIDSNGNVVADSHAEGAPEGPEPPAPSIVPLSSSTSYRPSAFGPRWPEIADRREIRNALSGHPSAYTRIRDEHPSVILFVAEPIRRGGHVIGATYVTRSTQPVLEELYRIRTGLITLMGLAIGIAAFSILLLAWSISRPLGTLARAARRIAQGERDVGIKTEGSGEIRVLSSAFSIMAKQLDQRLRYIEDFAADVAHEFKSPLTSIRGAAELLHEGAADDPTARERFLRNIQLDSERLDRLVSRLLELSRIDASREAMTEVSLRTIIDRVVERTTTPEQPVISHIDEPLAPLLGRATDLERAVLNLVENALRFSPANEPVRIEVAGHGREVHIAVEDRGSGVPETLRTKVFERFFTTDAERNGTGLGLSIVKSVAQAHGGRLYLDESWRQGARFVLVLPRR